MFQIVISDPTDNRIYKGQFVAENSDDATTEAREFYGQSLDMSPDDIEIIEIKEVK